MPILHLIRFLLLLWLGLDMPTQQSPYLSAVEQYLYIFALLLIVVALLIPFT